jgi:hypothetical protein
MEYRGPILLVFGMSLIMSPIAINLATYGEVLPDEQTDVAEVDIDTGCEGQTLMFANRSQLCTERVASRERDRSMPGGAMFVSARD